MINARTNNHLSRAKSTIFSDDVPIFDAFYELENGIAQNQDAVVNTQFNFENPEE